MSLGQQASLGFALLRNALIAITVAAGAGLPPGADRVQVEGIPSRLAAGCLPPTDTTGSLPAGSQAISGLVTDGDSNPLGGIQVRISASQSGLASATVFTNSDGTWSKSGLGDGTYRVSFFDGGGSYQSGFWSPGGIELTPVPATAIVLAGSGAAGIDASLPAEQRFAISGTVTDHLGDPVEGAGLLAESAWFPMNGCATSVADGTYAASDLRTAAYRVRITAPGQPAGYYSTSGFVTSAAAAFLVTVDGADATGIDIQFPETFSLSGVVLDAADDPVTGIYLTACEATTDACSSATSDGSGLFTIPALVAGDYTVREIDFAQVYRTGYYGGEGVFVATLAEAATISVTADVTGLALLAVKRGTDTPVGDDVEVVLDDDAGGTPVSLTFGSVTSAGLTTLLVADYGEPVPAGFKLGDPPVYYDIVTTSSFGGNVTVCIAYGGRTFTDEGSIRLYHFDEATSTWEDITVLPIDTIGNVVCGVSDSLSPFVVVEPASSFGGFFGPKAPPQLNTGTAGTSIGVKFSLGGDVGLDIFAPDSPTTTQISCATGEPIGAPVAASSGVKFNQRTGLHTFNWQTSKTWRKTCRALTLVFTGGTTAEVWYRF